MTTTPLYVAVGLSKDSVTTYCPDVHDTVAYGLVQQLDVILRRRRAFLASIGFRHVLPLMWAFPLASWLPLPKPFGLIAAVVGLLLSFPLLFVWIRDDYRKGLVFTFPSSGRVGWLERNRDALVVAVVTTLIGTVVGGLIVAAILGQFRLPQ